MEIQLRIDICTHLCVDEHTFSPLFYTHYLLNVVHLYVVYRLIPLAILVTVVVRGVLNDIVFGSFGFISFRLHHRVKVKLCVF